MSDKLRAAAKSALETLDCGGRNYSRAALILRAALAEPEEKLLSVHRLDQWLKASFAEQTVQKSLTVAEQEPVAWTTMPEAEDWCFVSSSKDPTGKLEGKWFPLYAVPPRREWVGLTDEEIFEIHKQVDSMQYLTFARAIETMLRERNGG